jgi:TRAP transporter 4TM/12TM fusion protein
MNKESVTDDQAAPSSTVKAVETRHRALPFPLQIVFYLFMALAVWVSVDFFFSIGSFGFYFAQYQYYWVLIGLLMPFVYLLLPATKAARDKIPWYDYLAAIAFCVIPFYFSTQYEVMQWGFWSMDPPLLSYILGIVLVFLVMESGRRSGGNVFLIVCIVLSVIPLISDKLPTAISSMPFKPNELVGHVVFDSEGFMGLPMEVIGGTLMGFLIFAGLLIRTGAGEFFLNLATAIGGHTRGGVAKVAVLGSAFFGSLSGSVLSNIAGTGSITIPGMKKTGFQSYYAGAVEACASTGGVLMPPVMGAVAFVMASMTQIPYSEIIVAALIPSILFYFALMIQVDCYAARNGLKGVPREELPRFWTVFKDGWQFIFVLAFLIWGMLYMRWELLTPFYASALLLLITVVMFKKTGFNLRKLIYYLEGIGKLLVDTIAIILPLAPVVSGLLITGIAPAFTAGILRLSGGVPFFALLLGFVACYILGMAGFLVSAYIFLALGLAPALVASGFDIMGVHLFIIYCAMLSSITPPVAAGAFLAANIAGAPPMKTAMTSMKMGIVLYLIPFFFVYEPALIMKGTVPEMIFHLATALLGVFLLACSMEGYLTGVGVMKTYARVVLGAIGLMLAVPNSTLFYIALGLGVLFIGYLIFTKRKGQGMLIDSQPVD